MDMQETGEDCSLDSILLPAPVVPGGTVATDASATTSASGVARVDGHTGATVLVRIAGRPSERRTSFCGEVLGGALVPQQLSASGRWLGDNRSALDIGTGVGEGWDYGALSLGQRSGRRITAWLQSTHAGMPAGSSLTIVHQRSHLSTSTAMQRAEDDRVLLEQADTAAEQARLQEELWVNISGQQTPRCWPSGHRR